MDYNGFEIDMLSLGDADCILVSRWENGTVTRVLIDGGKISDPPKIKAFLQSQGVYYIDHVVCSHPHDDHIGGLTDLLLDRSLNFGKVWFQNPMRFFDMAKVSLRIEVSKMLSNSTTETNQYESISKAFQNSENLLAVLSRRGIAYEEPFQGKQIAFLTVCGPEESYLRELYLNYQNGSKLSAIVNNLKFQELEDKLDALLEKHNVLEEVNSLDDNPQTDPINNTCTVLVAEFNGKFYLFTADVGVEGLNNALDYLGSFFSLGDCRWIQIPHHGSRRNINSKIISLLKPPLAYVSAAGNRKHPRRAVVNAFKKVGTRVYSTHYPNGGSLYHHRGDVPARKGYVSATPLWEKDKDKD